MAQKEYIKHLFENEDKSLREIAKEMKLSFQTVQKYAYMDDWNNDQLPNVTPNRYPVLEAFIPAINQWLEDDRKEPRKQRHTITKIYKRLIDEYNFSGSYSTVKKYVQKKKFLMKQSQEGFLPLAQPPAHAQIDFGSFKYLDTLDNSFTAYALTITFPYSNKGYTQVFKGQNQECLLEGMKRIFYHIGGVPIRIKADNMSTAVVRILKGNKRILTDGYTRFMLHHRFAADFCAPAAGNEKGNVENKVGYSRRNFFVPIPVIEDFDIFNEQLLQLCEDDGNRLHYKHQRAINELFLEESPYLLTLPNVPYNVFRYETSDADKYGRVHIDNSTYGLSPELSSKEIRSKVFFDRIEFYYEHSLLKMYERSYLRGEDVNDWKQYMTTLCRKPGAVEHTRFFNQLPKMWQSHLKAIEGKERKSALLLLMEIVEDNNTMICEEVLVMANKFGRVDHDSIRQCYYKLSNKPTPKEPVDFPFETPLANYNPNLASYDHLTGGALDD
jgi:transposase